MKSNNNIDGIIPLNNSLFAEFSIEELEARLETDPLMLAQVFGIPADSGMDSAMLGCGCKQLEDCSVLSCIRDSCPELG